MTSRPEIHVKALAEGLPYQTLIASILHKYVTGGWKSASQAARLRCRRPPPRLAARRTRIPDPARPLAAKDDGVGEAPGLTPLAP
jgi:hypothetical protein